MKNIILKSIFALVMTFMTMPMMGQDFMNVYFKDGTYRKFYLKNVTEITVSKLDANGVGHSGYEYQRITCSQNDYVYSLQDVDSVTFTKYDEEKVKENFDIAMPEVFSLFSKCKDISDVESMLDSFKNVKGVERVWTEGSKLYVKIPGWEPMPFHFENNDTSSAEVFARTLLPAITSTVKKDGEKLNAAIANQRGFNFEKLARYFRNCNIDVNYDSDKEPTLDFFLSGIYKYDLVFLFTHGAYLNGKHWLLTSHQLTDDLRWKNTVSEEMMKNLENILNREEYRDKQLTLGQDIDIHFSSGPLQNLYAYIAISEDCIKEKSVGKFPNNNSILFNGACESLIYGNSLAEIYLGEERGLGVYFGYDDDNFGSKEAGTHFFTSLLEGKSVTKSYYDIPEKYRDESGMINPAAWVTKAKLLPVTHKSQEVCDSLFLFPTYTNIISQDEVNEQFTNRSYVQVEGITRTLDPDAIELGFVYGTGENLTVDKFITDVELNYLGPSNNIGNFLFKGKLTDLESGKTYSYRAYTYDGTNYNYGNLESFTIYEKLTLSTNAITLYALTCGGVQITSGSGSYSIEKIEPTGVVTAKISENHISIEALTSGTAIITIKDDKSGQMATIEVKVTSDDIVSYLTCPDDHHPHLIDLGLPSGTKWACCNVGADAPESYGGYYAWGETTEKDYYYWSTYTHCDGSESTCHDLGSDIAGTQYDVAHVQWGGSWVMPSKEQQDELRDKCTYTWTTKNGINGGQFTGPNGGIIFLPAAGIRDHSDLNYAGSDGGYWSSMHNPWHSDYAYSLDFGSGYTKWYNTRRYGGQSVRPVVRN